MDNNQLTARTEFAVAINQIATERGISPDVILDAIKQALVASFKKDFPDEAQEAEESEDVVFAADIDKNTGEFKVLKGKEGDKTKDMKDITPPGFGRIAAQTAKQVIVQHIREAEKGSILDEYREKVGEVINGMVQRMDGQNVVIDIGRGLGVMLPEDQVRNEYYRLNSRLSVLIKDIGETHKGEAILVSRSDPKLVEGLFAREVPEVGAGSVVIKATARDAGSRTKVAVESTQDGVDPVGSCVGQKGVRVQAVINELNGEKIDIVQYSEDQDKFIKAALAPADGLSVKKGRQEGELIITVPHDQLSLAIGRGGQNVKLAAQLTQTRLKIISDQLDPGITVTGKEEYEIDQLGLPTKVRNLLVEAGLLRIENILYDPDRLDEVKGIGPKSVAKIKEQIEAYKPPKFGDDTSTTEESEEKTKPKDKKEKDKKESPSKPKKKSPKKKSTKKDTKEEVIKKSETKDQPVEETKQDSEKNESK